MPPKCIGMGHSTIFWVVETQAISLDPRHVRTSLILSGHHNFVPQKYILQIISEALA